MTDCTHPKIKCHKCHRYIKGDPDIPAQEPRVDSNGYAPADIAPNDHGFVLNKGPIMIAIKWTNEGAIIDVWDKTDPEAESLDSMGIMFNDCLDPYQPGLVFDPAQLPLDNCEMVNYELTQIPVR